MKENSFLESILKNRTCILTLQICSNLNPPDSIVIGAYPKSHLHRRVTGLQCL